jgi:hypothetical protein
MQNSTTILEEHHKYVLYVCISKYFALKIVNCESTRLLSSHSNVLLMRIFTMILNLIYEIFEDMFISTQVTAVFLLLFISC